MQDKDDKNGHVRQMTSDDPVPETLPSGGSGAEERLREADHEEGNAPARKGAEKTRDDGEV
jgi:hypothetical protein